MEKVRGIGGLFFPAHDPVGLAGWYRDHLGITPVAFRLRAAWLVPGSWTDGVRSFSRSHGLLWGLEASLDGQLSRTRS
jgi:hypothetical protein